MNFSTYSTVGAVSCVQHNQQDAFDTTMDCGDCSSDNPAEGDSSSVASSGLDSIEPVSLDEQIKAFEAIQAARARDAALLKEQQMREKVAEQQRIEQRMMNRRNNNKKQVRFADDALLYGSNIATDDVDRMWYNREELNEFKDERKKIVKVLKKANFNIDTVEQTGKYCLRGFEAYFSVEMNRAMQYARTLVASLVLTEQNQQRVSGYKDEEAIRDCSLGASQWARDNAQQLGKNDEVEVFGDFIMDEDDDDLEPLPYNAAPQQPNETSYSTNEMMNTMEEQQPTTTTGEDAMDEETDAERLDSALRLLQSLRG